MLISIIGRDLWFYIVIIQYYRLTNSCRFTKSKFCFTVTIIVINNMLNFHINSCNTLILLNTIVIIIMFAIYSQSILLFIIMGVVTERRRTLTVALYINYFFFIHAETVAAFQFLSIRLNISVFQTHRRRHT